MPSMPMGSKEIDPAQQQRIILTEINHPGIVIATKGSFLYSAKNTPWPSARYFNAPSALAYGLNLTEGPFTIKSLGECMIEVIDPKLLETDTESKKKLQEAQTNDLYHLALLAAALSERNTPLRLRRLFTILTSGTETQSPPIHWAHVAQLAGASRARTSKFANRLIGNDEISFSGGSFTITNKGKALTFNTASEDYRQSPDEPFKTLEAANLPPTAAHLSVLIEARQRFRLHEKIGLGLKLVTSNGTTEHRITEAQFGKLISASRCRLSEMLCKWEEQGLLIATDYRKKYKLTDLGREEIESFDNSSIDTPNLIV